MDLQRNCLENKNKVLDVEVYMKDNREEVRVMPSLFVLWGNVILIIALYGVLAFMYFNPFSRKQMLENWFLHCGMLAFTGGLPTILLIICFVQGLFSVVTIDATGVRRALLGKFRKRQMTWAEVVEIRVFPRVTPYILFTNKDLSDENLFPKNLIAHKNIIAVEMRKKVIDAIERFTDKEIVGIPKD